MDNWVRKEATSGKLQAARSFDTNKTQRPLWFLTKDFLKYSRITEYFCGLLCLQWQLIGKKILPLKTQKSTEVLAGVCLYLLQTTIT